ncbi:MAG: hypothetical protein LLG08_05455 [Actinomycetia bacterium]|nr:hypothetical protein [Actinomycetes bacterium]
MSHGSSHYETCEKCGYPLAHVLTEYASTYQDNIVQCGNCGHSEARMWKCCLLETDPFMLHEDPTSPDNVWGAFECTKCGGAGVVVKDSREGVGPRLVSYCRECGGWARWNLDKSGNWLP